LEDFGIDWRMRTIASHSSVAKSYKNIIRTRMSNFSGTLSIYSPEISMTFPDPMLHVFSATVEI
jgi:hypothetical protein